MGGEQRAIVFRDRLCIYTTRSRLVILCYNNLRFYCNSSELGAGAAAAAAGGMPRLILLWRRRRCFFGGDASSRKYFLRFFGFCLFSSRSLILDVSDFFFGLYVPAPSKDERAEEETSDEARRDEAVLERGDRHIDNVSALFALR